MKPDNSKRQREISAKFCHGFNRRVCSILGLPVDIITMRETVDHVYAAIDERSPCFISTPNLNFLIASRKEAFFRHSVINSDLSLADGMPILWIAKLLGIPLTKRVAGSSLIETLIQSESRFEKPVKVFFFGGMDGVADQACKKLNQMHCGISCVGSLNPGFGSIEDMSSTVIIDTINRSGAEFIIVSLGAKKGQAWIEHNRPNLDAPIISHLGAVVNFVAGTVKRAPGLWQRLNLEWLWRIKEEPALWKRYFTDGLALSKLLVMQVLPYAIIIHRNRHAHHQAESLSITTRQRNGEQWLELHGVAVAGNLQPVREVFASLVGSKGRIFLDLNDVSYIDPFFLGLILILYRHVGSQLRLSTNSELITKILGYHDMGFLLE